MRKQLVTSAIRMFVLACGPQDGDDDDIPGDLEYEQIYNRVYRLDRRIDVSFETESGERWECRLLTDRAYDDLESTLESLDPSTDYGEHPADCSTYGALVHIEGFEHSPFECAAECCHSDLLRAAIVYSVILNNFYGLAPPFEGEPYVAIEGPASVALPLISLTRQSSCGSLPIQDFPCASEASSRMQVAIAHERGAVTGTAHAGSADVFSPARWCQ